MAGLEKSTRIVQLKVRLLGLSPMIWRRVLVPESVMLRELHGILQVDMGWDGIHLYYFDIHAMRYGALELHVESPDTPLSRFGFRAKDRFAYLYDMGDHWEHEVRIEKFLEQNPKKMYPVCTGGSRACPPEDFGGSPGYRKWQEEATGYDAWLDRDLVGGFVSRVLEGQSTGDLTGLIARFVSRITLGRGIRPHGLSRASWRSYRPWLRQCPNAWGSAAAPRQPRQVFVRLTRFSVHRASNPKSLYRPIRRHSPEAS